MKITAGFNSVDDYLPCCRAGADELFCGYIPFSWMTEFSVHRPLNRREVLCSNVQIGGENELRILSSMMHDTSVPVTIAINYYAFSPAQYPRILDLILSCYALGFKRYILADHGLLLYLSQQALPFDLSLQISGEYGEFNPPLIQELQKFPIDRIIFHRQMSLDEMAACIKSAPGLSYEAFFLNEKCHFHGGHCQSLHCDALPPMCRVPYRLCPASAQSGEQVPPDTSPLLGQSGCAMCALYKLQQIGITNLKIVGRGNYSEQIIQDIRSTKRALEILSSASDEQTYQHVMRSEFFPADCSHLCYYRC